MAFDFTIFIANFPLGANRSVLILKTLEIFNTTLLLLVTFTTASSSSSPIPDSDLTINERRLLRASWSASLINVLCDQRRMSQVYQAPTSRVDLLLNRLKFWPCSWTLSQFCTHVSGEPYPSFKALVRHRSLILTDEGKYNTPFLHYQRGMSFALTVTLSFVYATTVQYQYLF